MIFPELLPKGIDAVPIIDDSFEQYREVCDRYSGLMRVGIDSRGVYDAVIAGRSFTASNEALGHPLDTSAVDDTRTINCLPGLVVDYLSAADEGITNGLTFQQRFLGEALVEHIMTKPDDSTTERITAELLGSIKSQHKLLNGSGVPEYVFFSKYNADTEKANELKEMPPQDIITPNGQIVTASRELIMQRLPELAELHESVFSGQTVQVGYYGGLEKDGIEAIVNHPDFEPIAAFDMTTGEALMLMLYAPDLKNFEALEWLNPRGIKDIVDNDPTKHVLTMPLVITSKLSGLGLFNPTVQLAGHHVAYEHKPETIYVTYESNGLSVLYTPKVIHRNLTNKLGLDHVASVAEATFVTESKNEA